jgi:hypothetical protein
LFQLPCIFGPQMPQRTMPRSAYARGVRRGIPLLVSRHDVDGERDRDGLMAQPLADGLDRLAIGNW